MDAFNRNLANIFRKLATWIECGNCGELSDEDYKTFRDHLVGLDEISKKYGYDGTCKTINCVIRRWWTR